jgi:hypothetical protein
MIEATIPDSAAGTITRVETSNFVAPTAYAPSRNDLGTALSASSESDATIGKTMIPTAIEADKTLKGLVSGNRGLRTSGVINVSAKYP